jgi:hypothetical protein
MKMAMRFAYIGERSLLEIAGGRGESSIVKGAGFVAHFDARRYDSEV